MAYVIGLGVNEKVQNTGEPSYAQFFLRCGLDFFPAFFFQKGSAVFLNIGLTQTCIAISVPPTWEPYKNTKRTTRNCKIIVRNNVFECFTLLKIEVKHMEKLA